MMKTLLIILLGCITSVNADWDACSSRLCQCDRYVAKCDDLNLTYIPTFPQRIQTVLFRNNHLPHINATTFTNLTGLYLLNLYIIFNGIKKIDNDSFTNLSPLEGLDLSGNIFTTRSLFDFIHIVSTTKVKKIILRYIGLTNIPNDLFTGYRTFPVKKLDFSRNQIQIFNYSIFKPITQLQLLDVRENRIAKVILDVGLNLEYLSLSNNNLRDLPDLCREMRYFPKLNTLQLQNNSINTFIPDNLNCIRRLMRLDLSLNGLDAIKTGDFHAFQSLNLLYVSSQRNPKSPLVIEDRAFNNSNLFAIYLHKNLLLSTRIHKNAFLGCTHLKKLDISENFFSDNLEKLNEAISPLTSLTQLLLYKSDLHSMPDVIGEKLHKLIYLEMGANKIKTWSHNFFINNKHLTNFTLNDNSIETVTPGMFPEMFRNTLQSIDISDNPFLCNCDLVWFVQWMTYDKQKFQGFPEGYRCIDITERICLKNTDAFISVTGVISVFVSVILLISFAYKYRWYIKYHIYIWRYRPRQLIKISEKHFDYDVFVSYCVEDSEWVLGSLLPNLEEGENIKLCIHERDFEPGKMIIDNIVQHMENSRKVIIVLSNDFTQSEWCQFEMTLAQKLVLGMTIESIIVVLLEEIAAVNMSKSLHALLKTTTYITWNNDVDEMFFWERLKTSVMKELE